MNLFKLENYPPLGTGGPKILYRAQLMDFDLEVVHLHTIIPAATVSFVAFIDKDHASGNIIFLIAVEKNRF